MGQDSETLSQASKRGAAHHGGLEMAVGSTRSFLPPILGQFCDPEEDQAGTPCLSSSVPELVWVVNGNGWLRADCGPRFWLGWARRPPRGWCSLCQALADPLRSLQLTSCALPHICLHFWLVG